LNLAREYIRLAYRVSRPRFWFYLAGSFTVGCIWGADRFLDLATPEFFLYLFYFLFPANVLLYGVNDYWDRETDLLNPKKEEKEYLVGDGDRARLRKLLMAILVFSVALLFFQKNMGERLIFGSFLFLSYFYSAKPFRFKAIPFLDFSSNVLYTLPGVFAYYQVTGFPPPGLVGWSRRPFSSGIGCRCCYAWGSGPGSPQSCSWSETVRPWRCSRSFIPPSS